MILLVSFSPFDIDNHFQFGAYSESAVKALRIFLIRAQL